MIIVKGFLISTMKPDSSRLCCSRVLVNFKAMVWSDSVLSSPAPKFRISRMFAMV